MKTFFFFRFFVKSNLSTNNLMTFFFFGFCHSRRVIFCLFSVLDFRLLGFDLCLGAYLVIRVITKFYFFYIFKNINDVTWLPLISYIGTTAIIMKFFIIVF